MKTYVINLSDRKDRMDLFESQKTVGTPNYGYIGKSLNSLEYERFDAVNGSKLTYEQLKKLGYDTDSNWIDPIHSTHLTSGEVGCFLSHYNLWKKCIELNVPLCILEDDAVVPDNLHDDLDELLETYNFIYLGWKEIAESVPTSDSRFVVPVYPYWTLAYVITPEAAKLLVNSNIEQNIIPVDEYLPLRMKDLKPIGYANNLVTSRGREVVGTDCHSKSRYDAFLDYNVHPITIGTDHSKCEKLLRSGAKHGIQFENIGKDIEWVGGDIVNSTGGGQKINILRDYISKLPDDDIVFYCDGYDVFVVDELDEFLYRYAELNHKVIFAAEQYCWPVDNEEEQKALVSKHFPDLDTKYKYLNSGVFIGRVSELKSILSDPIENDGDDQLYCQKQYLSEEYDMVIDTDCYMFQCHEAEVYPKKGLLFNPNTRCFNLLYHGNGGHDAKQKLNQLYTNLSFSSSPIVYTVTHKYDKLNDDMILIDFLTPSMCDSLIELSERHGGYKSLSYDKVKGQEIRLKELGLFDSIAQHWEDNIAPIIDEYWLNCPYYGMRDAFIIKYDMNGQRTLPLHSDASLVTGSIKLNDEYTGGELYFPRQNFSNKDIPVGKCILFPSQVSHPHRVDELLSGTKWSLTIWTNRTWNED
mgnify:FL=1